MSGNVKRAQRILESDRFGFVSGSKEMIRADIEDVISEYFYVPGHVKIELDPTGDTFSLSIKAEHCTLRSFNVLK